MNWARNVVYDLRTLLLLQLATRNQIYNIWTGLSYSVSCSKVYIYYRNVLLNNER